LQIATYGGYAHCKMQCLGILSDSQLIENQ